MVGISRLLLSLAVLGLAVSAAPAWAQPPPPPVRAQPEPFSPHWVSTWVRTSLWSGPDQNAQEYGPLPAGALLHVTGPGQGRFPVWNPLTDGLAWVDAAAVQRVPDPSDEEVRALLAFTPWWAMNHRPTTAWSSEGTDAEAWGSVPQWRYFEVISPAYYGRVLVREPRNGDVFYLDVDALGPVGPPPPEYFQDPPPDEEAIELPGRIIRDADWYEYPAPVDHFSVERLAHNSAVQALASVTGLDGSRWYRIGDRQYVPARQVRLPRPPDRTFPGRWIDADLAEPVLVTAYEDDRPIYSALAVKGTTAFQTPTGVFRIWRRVENETMDSLTLGIPRESRDGYYLKDVLFTQYFTTDGAALHYNYWRSNWGYPGSHGCLGMNYDDSLFFWQFASLGTPVYVRQ